MASISNYLPKSDDPITVDQRYVTGVEYNTGKIFAYNNKPLYYRCVNLPITTYDGVGTTWVACDWCPNADFAYIREVEHVRTDNLTLTSAFTWNDSDTSQFLYYIKTDGTAYQYRTPDAAAYLNYAILHVEWTKSTDSPVVAPTLINHYSEHRRPFQVVSPSWPEESIVDQEVFTGRYHPKTKKPLYQRVLFDTAAGDANDTYVNTGFTGIDYCYIARVDGFAANNRTYGAGFSYNVNDTSEWRWWCRTDGTQYQKRMSTSLAISNVLWYAWIYFEYTKTADVAAY